MPKDDDNTLLIGAKKIGQKISPDMTERQVLHLLNTGQIKGAFKLGHQHAIRLGRLRRNWEEAEAASMTNADQAA